jgi:hypothetical protein
MARSRNIKPGYFKNEILAECSALARILFTGLWCEADREGRLEDRPKRLKAAILPYDECSVDDLIMELAQRGFVQRYEVAGNHYIQILNFLKHQQPHHKEVASTIPGPEVADKQLLTHAQAKQAPSMKQASANQSAPCPTDSLIPDSLNLIPDSLQKTCPAKPDLDDFGAWYKAYPRHEAPDDARKAWDKRLRAKELPPLAEMLAAIEWQKRSGCLKPEFADGRSLIPLPATYLNKGRFKDAAPAAPRSLAAVCLYCPEPALPSGYCLKHDADERQFLTRSAA